MRGSREVRRGEVSRDQVKGRLIKGYQVWVMRSRLIISVGVK